MELKLVGDFDHNKRGIFHLSNPDKTWLDLAERPMNRN